MKNQNLKSKKSEAPLTLDELAKYNREVLLPAMSGVFLTKKDAFEFFATKQYLDDFGERLEARLDKKFDKINTVLDKILYKVDRIDTELTVLSERESRIVKVLEIFFAILQRNGLMVPDDIQKLTKQDILVVVNAK